MLVFVVRANVCVSQFCAFLHHYRCKRNGIVIVGRLIARAVMRASPS